MRISLRRRAVTAGALLAVLAAAGCGTASATPPVRTSPGTPTASPSPTATPSPRTTPSPTASPSTTATPSARPASVHVVGLGDSVTSGENCDCDDYVTGFGHLLAQRTGASVDVVDDGESGSTSDGLADELSGEDGDDQQRQSDVAAADVVVVTMGANDLTPALAAFRSGSCDASCYGPEVEQMQVDLGRVLDRVHALGSAHARVLVTNYWNVFTDGDVAKQAERSGYLSWSDTVTRQANAAIASVAADHGDTLVDLYVPFKGDGSADPTNLLADDGDHPDAAGTALISRAVLSAYEG